jgi:CelD/BcsL family acetyltransferase involved in cellulose biosynthesis
METRAVEIISIDPQTDPRWTEFILSHADASVFYHPSWLSTIESTYGYCPACLAAESGGELVGILPLLEVHSWLTGRRGVCLPFSDSCVPLANESGVVRSLLSAASGLCEEKGWKYVEIRGQVNHPSVSLSAQFKTHRLRLHPDADKVAATFGKRQVRQGIAHAIRDGVTIERRSDRSAMQEFTRLNALTRRKLGVPPQPDAWFLNLLDNLIAHNLGFVSIASLGGRSIAASVFLCFNNTIYYKYSASDERFLTVRPNNLIVWDAIQWGCENGYSAFDFGRTDIECEGLRDYKKGWGAVESDLSYYRITKEHASETADALRRMKPVLRATPVPVLKMIGRMLYEHVG